MTTDVVETMREPVAVVATHELVIGVDGTSVVVRLAGKGPDATYVRALTPEQALRIGASFMRSALRLKPGLSLVDVESLGKDRKLKIVNGSEVG